jgi:aromatic ring-opening dioxygenase catalytic subunit (LigB family)
MSQSSERTRRQALAAGLAGAGLAALPDAGCKAMPEESGGPGGEPLARMPVVYLPHGGGPWPFVDLGMDKAELDDLAKYLRGVRALPKTPPKALLVVSAHWEEKVPTVMTAERPPMLYDYYGFPPESYQVTWPAPGDPKLAARVRELLGAAGIATAEDAARGFDHGTFVPLKLAWPDADVPTVQLSLKQGLDPREHLAMGRALAPLRDEGVFVVGSGMSFHNMRAFRDRRIAPQAEEFDRWLRETIELEPDARDRRLADWANAPSARASHPREEHLLPLMVIAGAAGADRGRAAFRGATMGMAISGHHFG